MNTTQITNSLELALHGNFDRGAAVARLRGYVNKAGSKTLRIKNGHGTFNFYAAKGKNEKYLSKFSDELYRLARKRYCNLLIALLEARDSDERRARKLEQIKELLEKFEVANLDLPRIVLTHKQYKWYTGRFRQKSQDGAEHILGDEFVRSKSEQNIGLQLMAFAVPFHFEEQLAIYVKPLVDKIEEKIRSGDFAPWVPRKNLHYIKGGTCYWNLPPQLEWMNAPGSLWKTYDYRTGEVTIHPDFKIVLADGVVMLWEHEGLMDDPVYRSNASERVSILEFSRAIEQENLIRTYEFDTGDKQRLATLIQTRILPRLWW